MSLAHWLWENRRGIKLQESKHFHEFSSELSGTLWFDRIFVDSWWDGNWDDDTELWYWMQEHRPWILEVLFRSHDLTDNQIKSMLGSDSLLVKDVEALSKTNTERQFIIKSIWSNEKETRSAALLPDTAICSMAAMHTLIVLESALSPLGLETDTPEITVTSGSVKLAVSGGLFASGLSLLVACGEGLISTPLAIPAGLAIGVVGAIDMCLNWKKRSAEIEVLRAEQAERIANTLKLYSEAKKAEAETAKIRADISLFLKQTAEETDEKHQPIRDLEERISRLERGIYDAANRQITLPAASGKVDIALIRQESFELGIPVWLGCHLLNRSIPSFIELSHISQQRITIARDNKKKNK
jgi:hypothetical protein